MGASKLVTGPAVLPVSANELGAHLRLNQVDGAYPEESLLEDLISGATEFVETETGLSLIEQTWAYYLDSPPIVSDGLGWWDGVRQGAITQETTKALELPRAPLISITDVKYYDDEDTESTYDADNYYADTASEPGRLALRRSAVWPSNIRAVNGLVITYKAGYGADPTDIPFQLRQAVKVIAAHWYEYREAMTMDMAADKVPGSAWDILSKKKLRRL